MARLCVGSFPALLVAVLTLGSAACSSDPKPPPKAASDTPPASSPQPRKDVETPTSGSVHIEDRIVKACGDIPVAHFAFDSASIQPEAQASLAALARCFVSGPLKGQAMDLVGHADPRGTNSFNLGLGQKRAGSVALFLSAKGLPPSREATSSVGSAEATGTDEQGWAQDRKVEVFLAK